MNITNVIKVFLFNALGVYTGYVGFSKAWSLLTDTPEDYPFYFYDVQDIFVYLAWFMLYVFYMIKLYRESEY